MCKTLGADSCDGCKLHADGNDCVAVYEGEMDYAKVEKAVTNWAAENQEPVYPTWVDWLVDQGLIFVTSNTYAFNFLKATDPIPVDLAQKLGIEPKEG